MHGTHRKPEASDLRLAVDLMRAGLPAQFVGNITGVHTAPLMDLARLNVRARTEYVAPPSARPQRERLTFTPVVPPKRSRAEEVIAEVAEKHGLTVADLRGPQRSREYAWPRQEAMYRLFRVLGLSSTVTGRMLGGRDHTTVLSGSEAHEKRQSRLAVVE